MTASDNPSGRPSDRGCYAGYKIRRAHYERAADKRKTIGDMLEIRDFDEFFNASGYALLVTAKDPPPGGVVE